MTIVGCPTKENFKVANQGNETRAPHGLYTICILLFTAVGPNRSNVFTTLESKG
jgi:hypothetical protein